MIINIGEFILFVFEAYSSGHLANPDRKNQTAYLFKGLGSSMILAPSMYGEENKLLSQQPVFLKSQVPWCAMVAIKITQENRDYLLSNEAQIENFWLCRNYIFSLNRKLFADSPARVFQPRYSLRDWKSNFWRYGSVFDDNRVVADQNGAKAIRTLQKQYVDALSNAVSTHNINIANYAETSLQEELTDYFSLDKETHSIFIPGLVKNDVPLLKTSSLIGSVAVINAPNSFDRSLLGFHFDAMKLDTSESPGNGMLEFKDLYNILESEFDENLGEFTALKKVLKDLRFKTALSKWLTRVKGMYKAENTSAYPLYNGEELGSERLPRIYPSRKDITEMIAERIYKKRCAIIHSKAHADQKIVPGSPEEARLDFDLTLLRYISDLIISKRTPK